MTSHESAVTLGKVCSVCFRWMDIPNGGERVVCNICREQLRHAYRSGVYIAQSRRWMLTVGVKRGEYDYEYKRSGKEVTRNKYYIRRVSVCKRRLSSL